MFRLATALLVMLCLSLTLILPIYPEGLTPTIAAFLGLATVAGGFSLMTRAARRELAILLPWAAALSGAFLVGSINHGESRQALEDALPCILFGLGLCAGRGSAAPRRVLAVALWVCVIDSLVSLSLMPSYGPGVRSTFTYFKITAGLPLVGLYLLAVLRYSSSNKPGKSIARSLVHGLVLAILVLGLLFSITRGMLLGWLLGAAVSAYVRRPSRVLMAAAIVLVIAVAYSSTLADLGTQYLRLGQEGTIVGRLREIDVAWDGFARAPLFGNGLGALLDVDGFKKAFVHNMVAYHLWKFGLIGSTLLVAPLFALIRELRTAPRELRGHALGGAASVLGYLVTCAAYKTYYLVWIYGAVVGASLSWFASLRRLKTDAQSESAQMP